MSELKPLLRLLFVQLRVPHWIKNFLVFVPILAAHKMGDALLVKRTIFTFLLFCMISSAVYILNDIFDMRDDQNHKTKRLRPIASGSLTKKNAFLIVLPLILVTLGLGLTFDNEVGIGLVAYLLLNLTYSIYFKKIIILDIVILSTMYSLRVYTGSLAGDIPSSAWLLSFCTVFFFSIACGKRSIGINQITAQNAVFSRRGYRLTDGVFVGVLGISSGLLSILVILLYLQSEQVNAMYSKPQLLWLLAIILLYWISRFWLLLNRNEVEDDPVLFALRDRTTWRCFFLILLVYGAAI